MAEKAAPMVELLAAVDETPMVELLAAVDDPRVGRTVCAAVPIARGRLIIAERPLLAVPGMYAVDDRSLRKLYKKGALELRCGLESFLNVHAFVHASADVQRRMLEHFCSFDVHTDLASGVLPWDEPERRAALPALVRLAMRVAE